MEQEQTEIAEATETEIVEATETAEETEATETEIVEAIEVIEATEAEAETAEVAETTEENIIKDTNFIEVSMKEDNIEMLKKTTFDNPFAEEFSSNDVINRARTSDYIFEDLQKIEQERIIEEEKNRTEPFYISKKELDYLINDNPRLNIYKKNEEGSLINIEQETDSPENNFSNELKGINDDELIEISIPVGKRVIKEQQIPTTEKEMDNNNNEDGYYHHHQSDDEDSYYVSDEEAEELKRKEKMENTLKTVQDVITELANEEKYMDSDDLFREFLQSNFKDYLLAKKISGKKGMKYSNKILPKEKISENNEKIEVSDFHIQRATSQQKTSIIINRNEYAEIDSIEVFCKCGEKTVMRFKEQEISHTIDEEHRSIEITSNTDIVIDNVEVSPIYDVKETEDFIEYENKIAEKEIEEIERVTELEKDD